MITYPPVRTFVLFVLALLACCHAAVAADSETSKRYALPGHGLFQLTVPAGWTDKSESPSKMLAPIITFGADRGEPFIVTLTPAWSSDADKSAPSKEELRKWVEYAAEGIRQFAVETDLKVIEFAGASGPGFYFIATDRAPRPGEYKLMTQGMLGVGELSVAFTVLTNDGQDEVVRAALGMLRSAAHLKR